MLWCTAALCLQQGYSVAQLLPTPSPSNPSLLLWDRADAVLSYDAANLLEGTIALIERGEAPYGVAPCGSQAQGFQVRGRAPQGGGGGRMQHVSSLSTVPPGPHRAMLQVAVAVMQRLQVGPTQSAAGAAAAFARTLHRDWGVGSATCDNGVLLLLATRDRQVYISTGVGAEAAGLGSAAIAGVLDRMKPALRDARYGDALLEAVHEVGLVLAGGLPPAAASSGDWGIFAFFGLVVGTIFGWSWWSNRRREGRYKVGTGPCKGDAPGWLRTALVTELPGNSPLPT